MQSLKIPNLLQYETAQEFFGDLVTMNSESKDFSQRGLSQSLDWPASYLPDLLKGRKPLTVARAIQFAVFFKLGPIDFEKLIYLAILNLNELSGESLKRIRVSKAKLDAAKDEDADAMGMKGTFVFEVISWLRGQATRENVTRLLVQKGFDSEEVQIRIDDLVQRKKVVEQNSFLSVTTSELFCDHVVPPKDCSMFQDFADFRRLYFENPTGPGTFHSAFLQLNINRFKEIDERIIAFRNWLFEVSRSDSAQANREDILIYHLDLNLTPAISKKNMSVL